ncbi:MAG: hypothetical protein ACRC1T_09110 [Clostridium chrysemydis]|uniref:hypothetical protein n=1 Tax=Clostridium chrysemydis TaxID=2665504 RepID=UPI003F32D502
MKKTVMEWLSESKLLEKKIGKKENELLGKMYNVTFVHNEDVNYIPENIKSEYESLNKLKSNLDKIKDAIMVYNATTKIVIGEKSMSIAYALSKYTSGESKFEETINKLATKFTQDVNNAKMFSQKEKADLDRQLLTKNNISEKDKALIEATKSKYDIVVKDPLNIVELSAKIYDEKETFNNEVNNKINLSNALTELEIELD